MCVPNELLIVFQGNRKDSIKRHSELKVPRELDGERWEKHGKWDRKNT